jgi:hypothetical protein
MPRFVKSKFGAHLAQSIRNDNNGVKVNSTLVGGRLATDARNMLDRNLNPKHLSTVRLG